LRALRGRRRQGLFRQCHPELRTRLLDGIGDCPTEIEHQPHLRLRELVRANPNLPDERVSNWDGLALGAVGDIQEINDEAIAAQHRGVVGQIAVSGNQHHHAMRGPLHGEVR